MVRASDRKNFGRAARLSVIATRRARRPAQPVLVGCGPAIVYATRRARGRAQAVHLGTEARPVPGPWRVACKGRGRLARAVPGVCHVACSGTRGERPDIFRASKSKRRASAVAWFVLQQFPCHSFGMVRACPRRPPAPNVLREPTGSPTLCVNPTANTTNAGVRDGRQPGAAAIAQARRGRPGPTLSAMCKSGGKPCGKLGGKLGPGKSSTLDALSLHRLSTPTMSRKEKT